MTYSKSDVVPLIDQLYKPQASKYDLQETILGRAYSEAEMGYLHRSLTRQVAEDHTGAEHIIAEEIAQGCWYGDFGWTDGHIARAIYAEFAQGIQDRLRHANLTVSNAQARGIIEGLARKMREKEEV